MVRVDCSMKSLSLSYVLKTFVWIINFYGSSNFERLNFFFTNTLIPAIFKCRFKGLEQ